MEARIMDVLIYTSYLIGSVAHASSVLLSIASLMGNFPNLNRAVLSLLHSIKLSGSIITDSSVDSSVMNHDHPQIDTTFKTAGCAPIPLHCHFICPDIHSSVQRAQWWTVPSHCLCARPRVQNECDDEASSI